MKRKTGLKNTNIFLVCAKYLSGALCFYLNWYKQIWGNQNIILYGVSALLLIMVALDMLRRKKVPYRDFPQILAATATLCVFSLATGVFVAVDRQVLLSTVATTLEFSIMAAAIWYVCKRCHETTWVYNILELCGAVCALQTIFLGADYNNGVIVTAMSESNNPNLLGLVLLFGIFSAVIQKKRLEKNLLLHLVIIVISLYAIILSASRKTFLAAIVFLTIWLVVYLRDKNRQKINAKTLLVRLIIIVGAVIGASLVVSQIINGSALTTRMLGLREEISGGIRRQLYAEAWEMWKQSPIIGVGLGQFVLRSRFNMFTHSVYAETLVSAGIVGILIYAWPFFAIGRRLLKRIRSKKLHGDTNYDIQVIAVCLIIEMFMGLGSIFYYYFPHILILTMLFYEEQCMDFGKKKKNAVHHIR
ncbi:MAG: O-antigen ligase family protein [Eubacteriales bacterium]|nr:O-antigen ligase family protein [Eubacteriales bacterium]